MSQKDDWHLTEILDYEHGRGDPFAAAVRATRMAMVITDPAQPDNPIVFCNEAFQHLTGYSREEIIGRNCRFLQGEGTDRSSVARIRAAIDAAESIHVDLLNYRKDGSTFWNALFLSPVRGESGDVQFFFASQLDVTDRVMAQETIAAQKAAVDSEVKRRTADLEKALEAKTLLLHEVDHRVKNNLTMIGALLRLQVRSIDDADIRAKLETMMERIDALATVHRRLYQADDVTRFDVAAFAANLASDVIGASGRSNIRLRCDIEPIEVRSEHASALGLILNEVLTNAIKHGLRENRAGSVSIFATRDGEEATLSIEDDGVGLIMDPASSGLGHALIKRLSPQSGTTVAWDRLPTGTRVTLRIPEMEHTS
ncbi:histidine kinase [Rhizobium sp. Leaf371]|uniref:PAS domain-containing protein n=1 Tax=Rhizobium sp. Leaf371 TaxID=1736355 RepID=UPI0007154F45|nr:PAS domain-containing protein [Rhizobium sp. Leaf371]KQS64163.1 histidine kinase [Rhizobium sp. Leaf371]